MCSEKHLRQLYPPPDPYESGMLKVSDFHEMLVDNPRYWEECGNPEGHPILFVHGGPGGGIDPKCRRFFDPELYRIILFTQRGCGKSTPLGCLTENTTWHLVQDMEELRKARDVSSWVLFGGSWGSALSLAYAQTHPEVVNGMILRGIFTARRQEIDWFYEEGRAGMLAPKKFATYRNGLPSDMQVNASRLLDAFHSVLNGSDEDAARRAALAWSGWEGAMSYFSQPEGPTKFEDSEFAIVFARIECHYFKNNGFFPRDGYLLEAANMDKIRKIPVSIVQGLWDLVCPVKTAYDLSKAMPEAKVVWVANAGHSAFESGITSELVKLTDEFASKLSSTQG